MQSVNVFQAMCTQWRVGMGGPIGLDYNVLPEIWRRTKTPIQDRDSVFLDLQLMEDEALKTIRAQRDKK